MILYKKATEIRQILSEKSVSGQTIGFVPTMGALHEGHLELIKHSKLNNNITISSIFVNPTQFNDPKDFEKYPVTLDQDLYLLEKAGCDLVFLPSVSEIYPLGTQLTHSYELGYLETTLEGKYRPGHFQGVCQVVHRLLDIVQPDTLYLGQKDYQQSLVIEKLITQLPYPIRIHVVPTFRDASGLALSSRNLRLTEPQKMAATGLYRSLVFLKENLAPGDLQPLLTRAKTLITEAGFSA
ncbi:MAG: pantoate--beta-alanine ligase, partial [Bacteroidota bacterium]|nr:pantoate--beta-alanine ligase [Bacteroidota bacterium]